MIAEGRVYKPKEPLADQSVQPFRMGPEGGVIVQTAHGSDYLSAINESTYFASTPGPTGVTTTVATATTYTGLCLSNPIGSGVILAVKHVHAAFGVVFPAAAFIGLMGGYHSTTDVVHTTPALTYNAKLGTGGTGKGKCDSAATLPVAPTVILTFGSCLASAAGDFEDNFSGGLQLPPGAFIAIYTSTISGASALMATMSWEEINKGA